MAMLDDFNSIVMHGARVALRSVQLTDSDELFRLISGSRDHLQHWLPWVEFVRTADDERHIVEQWVYEMQMKSAIHLCITMNSAVVGLVGTHQIDWMNQRTSVGYWMSKEKTGRHFTTEATAVLLVYLFDKIRLHRVVIQAATQNEPSNKVIRNLGFKFEGVLRENERIGDLFLDHNAYAMTEQDFAEIRRQYSVYVGISASD